MGELVPAQLEAALVDYAKALAFTMKTHASDLTRIDSLDGLMTDFDSFFYEFVYVVLASGFRGRIAARLTPELVACRGDMARMTAIFKNQRKLSAIAQIWGQRGQWKQLRDSFTSVDALTTLPIIGEITKFHLARNIGLTSCAKPDLHLCRWCGRVAGRDDEAIVPIVTQAIADRVGRKQGTVDFALWVWLSHGEGEEMECCHGGFALR
jgi:hypothetical protein